MSAEKIMREAQPVAWVDGLPADHFWMPGMRDERMMTPVDDRGLIVIDKLIERVKSCISPEYRWPHNTDLHHIYYEGEKYRALQHGSGGLIPAERFRQLSPNKIRVPRVFHTVLHRVMYPPPMPEPDVMRYYSESWNIASNLFRSVRDAVRTERLARQRAGCLESFNDPLLADDPIGKEVIQETFTRHFRGVSMYIDALETIPREFWLIDPDKPILAAMGKIGGIVLKGERRRVRAVRRPIKDVPIPRLGK